MRLACFNTCVKTHTPIRHHSPCTRSVQKGVAILATLTLKYGIKITANQKTNVYHTSNEVQNIQNHKDVPKGYRHLKRTHTLLQKSA